MNLDALHAVAMKMVAPGRGLLAADESTGTIQKRFDAIGVENTEPNRRDYRELMFRAADAMTHISSVILYDETPSARRLGRILRGCRQPNRLRQVTRSSEHAGSCSAHPQ